MKNKIAQFFKLNNWKRAIISFITIISALLAIVFGSVYYIGNNVNKSIDYGGGIEVLLQVKKDGKVADPKLTEIVNKSLTERLTGGVSINGISVSSEGDGKIRITKSGKISEKEKNEFIDTITNKPILTLTNTNIQPIFYDGKFVADGSLEKGNASNWIPPIEIDSANVITNPSNGQPAVELSLKPGGAVQWTEATKYISEQPQGQNRILMWLNIEKLLELAKTKYTTDWDASGQNLWNFIHVGNKAFVQTTNALGQPEFKPSVLKEKEFNASNYLISDAQVNGALTGDKIQISGNFTPAKAAELAGKINYGISNYDLDIISSAYIDQSLQNDAFYYAMIAGIVIFSLISLFMIVNYGLLGALSTISIALYVFLTLLIFTALRGEYSPATIAALIIGIGISVDANVITYERLKRHIYEGEALKKSYRNANRLSLSSIIDANLTTIIVGFILFYFGTKDVRGFSVTLVLSVLFTLLVMLVFSRFLATLLVSSGLFENRLWLLGIRKRYINHKTKLGILVDKNNYLKQAKWFALGSIIFILIGIIVFTSISASNKELWAGFNRSIEFSGGINIAIRPDAISNMTKAQASEILQALEKANNNGQLPIKIENFNDVVYLVSLSSGEATLENWSVVIRTQQDFSVQAKAQMEAIKQIAETTAPSLSLNIIDYLVSTSEAHKLVLNAIIATSISFIGIVLYLLVRMNWTYSIAAIIGLLHDFLMVIAFIVISRLQVSPIIVAALLSILGLSINDTVVTFDKIRETIHTKYPAKILSKDDITHIVNSSIAETLKRSLYTSGTTITAILVLLSFHNATNFTFNVVMLFGITIGVYSSIFICSWIWAKIEYKRQRSIERKINSGYWNINNPDEQTFSGVNDYLF
ncbi:protein translocase subunit SecDF [Mycoplasma sp. Pen4]|uniref:protein translocase subunit SecDF n=1 Tax=Mycoplasma sp. Pen4 TaxID=640330 RepID=UPI0016548D44|nr:protein translocase subunit SecDF [Mycoplasma sp. Pen4]QNM93332.1 protein translocase subunit SecDF [Mycoplasma sp. Pen4]